MKWPEGTRIISQTSGPSTLQYWRSWWMLGLYFSTSAGSPYIVIYSSSMVMIYGILVIYSSSLVCGFEELDLQAIRNGMMIPADKLSRLNSGLARKRRRRIALEAESACHFGGRWTTGAKELGPSEKPWGNTAEDVKWTESKLVAGFKHLLFSIDFHIFEDGYCTTNQ